MTVANRVYETAIPHKTLADLEWHRLCETMAGLCRSEAGGQRARTWPLFDRIDEARQRQAEVQESALLADDGFVAAPAGEDLDLGRDLEVVAKRGVLDAEPLRRVAAGLKAAWRLRRDLMARRDRAPRLAGRASALRPLEDVWGPILDSFGEDGALRDEASADLGAMRARARSLRERIVERLETIMADPDMEPVLQDNYYTLREGRYVLPVKVEMQHFAPGIIHARSQTGQTVFVEPSKVTELGNKLKMAIADVEMEEARVFAELTALLAEELPSIRANMVVLADLDAIAAGASLARKLDAVAVDLVEGDEGGRLNLVEARHPFMVVSGDPVVANSFALDRGGCLVVTGPNAGGKTVALKTLGMAVLMARAGLPICCRPLSVLPFYGGLYTTMGDDQDIASGLSTFTAHMSVINRVLRQAGPDSLVLLDEVAVGTEPTQGAALAQAILERLADSGCSVVVTTHYTTLKALAATDPRFRNAAMGFDPERLEPTYQLELDAMGRSSALDVARSIGLPQAVIERASELLGGQQLKLDGLLADVEQRRADLETEIERARREAGQAAAERRKAAEIRTNLASELDRLRRRAHDEAVVELRSLRADLDRFRKRLRKVDLSSPHAPLVLQQVEERASKGAARLTDLAPEPEPFGGTPMRIEDVAPKQTVIVASMRAEGLVESVDQRGRVVVRVGGMKVTVRVDDLLRPDKGKMKHGSAGSKGTGRSVRGGKFDPKQGANQTKSGKMTPKMGKLAGPGGKNKPNNQDEAMPSGAASSASGVSTAPSLGVTSSMGQRTQVEPHSDGGRVADEFVIREEMATVDLRAMTRDEALDRLDVFLDQCLRDDRPAMLVIHGHGTGVLKAAVREYARHSPVVRRFRPGARNEGGDGVTILFLDL